LEPGRYQVWMDGTKRNGTHVDLEVTAGHVIQVDLVQAK
jgi:hypothetical protein